MLGKFFPLLCHRLYQPKEHDLRGLGYQFFSQIFHPCREFFGQQLRPLLACLSFLLLNIDPDIV